MRDIPLPGRGLVFYFAFSVFLSAFLLFQVQPMIAKYILPWFGGTPAVWSTTMLFFQVGLTGGYAYTHWLLGRHDFKRQAIVHVALLVFSLVLLALAALGWKAPIIPDASWKPVTVDLPVVDIFKILTVSVGLPYFLLATNGPLVQAWFARVFTGRLPYRLYAVSNLGSLLALVSYPVLFEPALAVQAQARLWTLGYIIFALCAACGAIVAARRQPAVEPAQAPVLPPVVEGLSLKRRVLWVGLAACASTLLLATTSQLSQEVAVIPFLWVLPLVIYLFTFILCFDGERWYNRTGYALAFAGAVVAYSVVMALGPGLGLVIQIGVYCLLLFVSCMICHGELVNLKPHPRHLTSYYLMISIGGALGGTAVALIAPYVFKEYWELQFGLIGCAALLITVTWFNRLPHQTPRATRNLTTLVAGALLLIAGFLFLQVQTTVTRASRVSRNFYGVLRVNEVNPDQPVERAYRLANGIIIHGFQFVAEGKRRAPTTYYTESSGVGLALLNHPRRPAPLRIGILGLGIGVLAAYGQPGDTIRFYEINPDVIRLAEGEGGYFSYLHDSSAQVQVVPGDARVSLEKELAEGEPEHLDLLVVDTFTGDSIPIHLLTEQAFEVYLRHLQPDGVLAFHISNLHLDLRPVIWRLADRFQLGAVFVETPGEPGRGSLSSWMLLTRDQAFLNSPAISAHGSTRPDGAADLPLWTDDYSNLFRILK